MQTNDAGKDNMSFIVIISELNIDYSFGNFEKQKNDHVDKIIFELDDFIRIEHNKINRLMNFKK